MKKIVAKSWFVLFKPFFGLYIWIEHPQKPRGHFDCEEFTCQTCDFNESLPDSRQIRLENKPKTFQNVELKTTRN